MNKLDYKEHGEEAIEPPFPISEKMCRFFSKPINIRSRN
jgi:hypothetical protein